MNQHNNKTDRGRRKFISMAAAGGLLGGFAAKAGNLLLFDSNTRTFGTLFQGIIDSLNTGVKGIDTKAVKSTQTLPDTDLFYDRIIPAALGKGSTVAITAPASPTGYWEMRQCFKTLKNIGCKIEIGDTIKQRNSKSKYLSAPDEKRASEFMEFICRQDIDCIICGRGGFGTMRILPYLNFDDIKANPKIIIGFSDITALLNAIHTLTGIVCFHGPVAISNFSSFSEDYFLKVLTGPKNFEPIKITEPGLDIITPGKATGRLVGGNLSMLVGTLGTRYEFDSKDAILFIEEVSEHPYKIDKMLTQLWLAGKLHNIKGVMFGSFKGLDSKRPYDPGGSFTLRQVLESRIKPLAIPAVIGMPFGHNKSNVTLPIGINAELDTKSKTLKILEQSVI